jgi:hypothetical protein
VSLVVAAVGERIIVNLPGARFTMTFEKDPEGPGIVERAHWTRDDPDSIPREGVDCRQRQG